MKQNILAVIIVIAVTAVTAGCSRTEAAEDASADFSRHITITVHETAYVLEGGIEGYLSDFDAELDGLPIGLFSELEGGMLLASSNPITEEMLGGNFGPAGAEDAEKLTVAMLMIEQPVRNSGTYTAALMFIHSEEDTMIMAGSEEISVVIDHFGAAGDAITGTFSGPGDGMIIRQEAFEELDGSMVSGEFSVLRGTDIPAQ